MWPPVLNPNTNMHILLIEDDAVDAEALQRALIQYHFDVPLTVVENGKKALELLREHRTTSFQLPRCLILLDINMPQMNGIEFLEALRQDDKLKQCIVFVWTTSEREEDKLAAYSKQIAGYLIKSTKPEYLEQLVLLLKTYNQTIEFPPEMIM